MSVNPFGVSGQLFPRTRKLASGEIVPEKNRNPHWDLIKFLDSPQCAAVPPSPEKWMAIWQIQDASANYMFFGLGRNGTSVEEFWYACEYLFRVRSTKPETWGNVRKIQNVYREDGHRVRQNVELSDAVIKNMCFDVHYENSGLDRLLPMPVFLEWMLRQRRRIITENFDQVSAYVKECQAAAEAQIADGRPIPFRLLATDPVEVLVHPNHPEEVSDLFYVSNKVKRPIRQGTPKGRRVEVAIEDEVLKLIGHKRALAEFEIPTGEVLEAVPEGQQLSFLTQGGEA